MKKIILLGCLLLAATAVIFYFSGSRKETGKPSMQPGTSQVIEQGKEKIPAAEKPAFLLSGTIVPSKTQDVAFKVGGILEKGEADLSKGSRFSKNQLLFQVNNSAAFMKLQEAKLALKDKLQPELPKLKVNLGEKPAWDNYIATLEPASLTGELPEARLPEVQALLNSLRIAEDHQRIRKMETQMAAYFYIAPFDGIVLETMVNPGKNINPGQTVAQIGAPGKLLIKAIAGKDFPAASGKTIQVLDMEKELVGKGSYLKSVQRRDGSFEVYYTYTLKKGKKLPLGSAVLVEVEAVP